MAREDRKEVLIRQSKWARMIQTVSSLGIVVVLFIMILQLIAIRRPNLLESHIHGRRLI